MKTLRILMLMRDTVPPWRPDVKVLFGEYLKPLGIHSDLIGPAATRTGHGALLNWPGGAMHATRSGGILYGLRKPFFDLMSIFQSPAGQDIFQARDRTVSALIIWAIARLKRRPFTFWMSFPIVEGYEERARDIGQSRGKVVWFANWLRAKLSRTAYYGFIAKRADHLFVQSDAMLDWMHQKGIPRERMTAVPMGVDARVFRRELVTPSNDSRLDGKRVLIYLGTLARARSSEFLMALVTAIKAVEPNILLVLAGDAASPDEAQWIRQELVSRHLQDHILLTGWLEQSVALGYAVRAEVGLSPIPRGILFDVSSPTKLVEYLALGIPSVANDIPDQQLVIERSGAGICVPMEIKAFGDAVLRLLHEPELHQRCVVNGPKFVFAERSYEVLARRVAEKYGEIVLGSHRSTHA